MATTWDPSQTSANIALSGGNLVATTTALASWASTIGTQAVGPTDKRHWELTVTSGTGGNINLGLGGATRIADGSFVGGSPGTWGYNGSPGVVSSNNIALVSWASFTAGDRITFEVDGAAQTMTVWKNGSLQGTISSMTATYPEITLAGSSVITANFGATAFSDTLSTGYSGFDTASASVQIESGSAADAISCTVSYAAVSQTDSGTATDTTYLAEHVPVFITEAGIASDFVVSGFGPSVAITESGTATDATDRSWGTAGAITEAGTASDASDQGTIGLAHEIESDPWATDAPNATNTTNSAITEVGGATDTSLSNRQWEDWAQGLATDTTDALAYMGASQEDDGAATDAPIAINFTYPQVAQEILNAIDTVAGGVSTAVAIAESGTASDATDATAPLRKGSTILYRLELVASNVTNYGVPILAYNTIVVPYSFQKSNTVNYGINSNINVGNQVAYSLTSRIKQGCEEYHSVLTYNPVVADSRVYYGMPAMPIAIAISPNPAIPIPAIVPSQFYQNLFAQIPAQDVEVI